jgi:hypothetical protein
MRIEVDIVDAIATKWPIHFDNYLKQDGQIKCGTVYLQKGKNTARHTQT